MGRRCGDGMVWHGCAGVAYLHAQRLMHRDLKPRNVFLLADAGRLHVRLGDFGLARGLEMTRTPPPSSPAVLNPHLAEPSASGLLSFDLAVQHTMFSSGTRKAAFPAARFLPPSLVSPPTVRAGVGTTTYAAPEQLKSSSYDHRCDIYSLGLCEEGVGGIPARL